LDHQLAIEFYFNPNKFHGKHKDKQTLDKL